MTDSVSSTVSSTAAADPRPDLFAGALAHELTSRVRCADVFDDFMGLSEVLVGTAPLPRWVGRAYLDTLRANAGKNGQPYSRADIAAACRRFAELPRGGDLEHEVLERIVRDPALGDVARAITFVWYNAGLPVWTGPFAGNIAVAAPNETYTEALVWDAISAHPPGIPGPYYGAWAYPPPTPVAPPLELSARLPAADRAEADARSER